MEGFISNLRKSLQTENVLESQAGYLSHPSELMLVPKHFTNGADPPQPLFDDILNTFKYVSFSYSSHDLEALGLTYQTPQQICALLKWMSPEQLEHKPLAWHSRLAAGIAESDHSVFRTAKLIPLRTGEWISAVEEAFYFPSMGDDVDVPVGIEVKVISKTACADPPRKHLFSLLGAKPLTAGQICNLILDRHRFLSLSNNNLSASCLVSHAWYLFSYGSLNMNYGTLKLANELGQAVPGNELYMQLPDCSFRTKDYLPSLSFAADFVHTDYLTQGTQSDRSRWYKWLTDTMHVSFLPNFSGKRNRTITREFQHLINKHPSRVWLTLVRDNWRHYSADSALVSNIAGPISVDCTNQQSCQLEDAYLATTAILQEPLADRHIYLIDVPDPRNADWINLTRLGLHIRPDLHFYLTILRGVAKTHSSDANKDTMLRLYRGVETHCNDDLSQAKYVTQEDSVLSHY